MDGTAGVSPRRPREPRQGILLFVIRHGHGEAVTAHAGLPLVVAAARAVRLEEVVEEDLIVADEFRDGDVPGNTDPLTSVRRAFAALPAWVEKRYFRGDSADYYGPLLKYLVQGQIRFSISADMSPELRAVCLAVPPEHWVELTVREHEVMHGAEVEFTPGDWPKTAQPLRYVGLRITPLQRELFAERRPKYLAVVTNRPAPEEGTARRGDAMSAAEPVRWHWEKAGTIEHVHRSLKDELGGGVLPSQRFGANAAWFRINAITYNLLTLLKRRALPERLRLARPTRLRFEVFNTAARLSVHQSQLIATLAASRERTAELVLARQRLLATRQALGQSPMPTR